MVSPKTKLRLGILFFSYPYPYPACALGKKLRTRTLFLHPDLGDFPFFPPVACLLPYLSFDLSGVFQNEVAFVIFLFFFLSFSLSRMRTGRKTPRARTLFLQADLGRFLVFPPVACLLP